MKSVLRSVPVTATLVGAMWLVHVALLGTGQPPRDAVGYHLPADTQLWHLATASTSAASIPALIMTTIAALVFAVPAERLLGSGKFSVAAIASHFTALPIGFVVGSAIERAGFNLWGPDLVNEVFLSPVAWIFGPLAFSTSRMGVLWKRRMRVIGFALCGTLVLYNGSLSSVVALTAFLLGGCAGVLMSGVTGKDLLASTRMVWHMSLRESRVLVATLFLCVGFGPVITALNPSSQGPFAGVAKLMWQPSVAAHLVAARCADPASAVCAQAMAVNRQHGVGPFLLNAVPLLLVLVMSLGLVRGRRLAWGGALVLTLGSIVMIIGETAAGQTDIKTALNIVLVVFPWVAVLLVLSLNWRKFEVESDWRAHFAASSAVFAATSALWVFGAWGLRDQFAGQPTFAAVVEELPLRYLPPVFSEIIPARMVPLGTAAWFVYEWVGIIFWAAALFLLFRIFSSVPSGEREADRLRARQILRDGTGDHLSWMGLWPGNRYFFIDSSGDEPGEGYVAYRVAHNIAVTVGGPAHSGGLTRDEAAAEFEMFAASQGWRVAWYSVPDDFTRPGFRSIHVAEESVLYTDNIEFKGKKFQNIRTARNRAEKEGVSAVWTSWSDCGVELREKIIALSEQWVAEKALPEMGFTLGGLEELRDDDTKLLLAVDTHGHVHAVTSWLPVYESGVVVGYTLDFMRRDAQGFRPAIEFLLAEGARIAAEQRLEWVSLSGAPLARSDEPTSPVEVILDRAGASIEPLYGFRSLAASKYKFHPAHNGWYMLYEDEMSLASIGLAVVNCYLPNMKTSDVTATVKEFVARRGE